MEPAECSGGVPAQHRPMAQVCGPEATGLLTPACLASVFSCLMQLSSTTPSSGMCWRSQPSFLGLFCCLLWLKQHPLIPSQYGVLSPRVSSSGKPSLPVGQALSLPSPGRHRCPCTSGYDRELGELQDVLECHVKAEFSSDFASSAWAPSNPWSLSPTLHMPLTPVVGVPH